MGDKLRTLSDAILLGSTFRPQSFKDIYKHGRTCALGAAAEAIGIDVSKFDKEDGPDNLSIQEALEARFADMVPVCKGTTACMGATCHVEGCFNSHHTIHDMVVHLNDDHKWKRERIAAYLKTKGL